MRRILSIVVMANLGKKLKDNIGCDRLVLSCFIYVIRVNIH
jgi:hypothetical protein